VLVVDPYGIVSHQVVEVAVITVNINVPLVVLVVVVDHKITEVVAGLVVLKL
jgi:hypothetical protein